MQSEALAILDDIKTAQVIVTFDLTRFAWHLTYREQAAGSSSIALLCSQPGTSEIER